jgi:hypothetical protein
MYIAIDFPSMQRDKSLLESNPSRDRPYPSINPKSKPEPEKLPLQINSRYEVRGGLKLEKVFADCCSWWDEIRKQMMRKRCDTPAKTEMTKSKS